MANIPVAQEKTGNSRNCPDLRAANPLLVGSSRSRSLHPLGRSEFESAAAVMDGALSAVGAEVSVEVAVMVDEVISPTQHGKHFGAAPAEQRFGVSSACQAR